MVDILVLNDVMHGIPSESCAATLSDRLPDTEVVHADSPTVMDEALPDARIVVGDSLNEEELDRAESLEWFACTWAGVGHLDLEAFGARDIVVTNAAGVHGPNIAEHVIGWFLMIGRRLDEGIRRQRNHEWRHFQAVSELHGSTVCIVGLGAIGRTICRALDGFCVETIGVRYTPAKGGPTDSVYGFDEIHTALSQSKYVVIACPLTKETRGLIGHEEFNLLSHDAIFVNIGRGPIVETDALVQALRSNSIHAAAVDVTDPEPLPPDHELWGLENAYITPHNAGHTPAYWDRLADIIERNLEHLEATGTYDGIDNRVV